MLGAEAAKQCGARAECIELDLDDDASVTGFAGYAELALRPSMC